MLTVDKIYNIMIRNFFTTTLRGLLKNKPYFLINTLGLALGVCGALIIFTKIRYELSFDRFHTKAERIYRINTDEHHPNGDQYQEGTYYPVAHLLRNDFLDMLESVTHTKYEEEGLITIYENNTPKRFKEKGIGFVEPQFFEIFEFCTEEKWLAGNPETAIVDKKSVVLTKTLAQKYFHPAGDYSTVLGQRILYGNKIDMVVTGVVEDFPPNTDFPFNMLIPFDALEGYDEFYSLEKWNFLADNVQCYVLLAEDYTAVQLEGSLPDFARKYIGKKADKISFRLQPLADIHFNPRYSNFSDRTVRYEVLWGLGIIAFMLIITACINFINLATAQSVKRSKEVGIRKVLGSSRGQLVAFFLGETFIITAFAVLLALGAAEAFLFKFHDMLDIVAGVNLASLPGTYFFLLAVSLLVTLLAGLYPALVLSSFRPMAALKNSISGQAANRSRFFLLRKGLVMVQFTLSQVLIIGTLVVSQQMQYFQNKSLGFDKEAIILASLPDTLGTDKLEVLKNQMLDNPYIRQVSFSIGSPTAENNLDTKFKITASPDADQAYSTEVKTIDEDYLPVFDLQIAAGRALTQADLEHKRALVNETLVKTAGITQPEAVIGEQIQILGDKYEIIGVVKDFHTQSFHEKINPCALFYFPHFLREAAIKIDTEGGVQHVQEAITHLEKVWNTSFPEYVFDYQFLDDYLTTNYEQENKTFRYFQLFSGLAILIGCLGLYGLVSFLAEQKTKEVGIRKVLGASVGNIIGLFSKEYISLILLAFLIAAPLAYYFMHSWLENFAYQIDLKLDVFASAILISICIAFLTVGYKSYRAAVANPVESLRSE